MFSKLPCIISLPRHYVGIMYAISMIYIYYIYKKISKKSYIIEVYTISTRFLLKNYVYHPSYPDHLSTVSNISIYTYLCLSISIYINLYLPISIYIYLYLSISINIYQYLSISISIYLYLYISIYI